MMTAVRSDLPSGTVTFLFTDVEGSTRLLHQLGAETYAEALAEHGQVIREACASHGGIEVDTQGDAFFIAFPTAPGALEAASEALRGLASGPIRVRMGIHTGTPHVGSEGYVGVDVHRAARIAACGHGGQVLISASTASLLGEDELCDLGEHRLKDLSAPERIYQLGGEDFPPLASLHQSNLPIPATPFLGRELELREVLELLSRDDVRLLTLTGPGGTGKTRLAAQAAALTSGDYADGVWWVPLAPLRDPALVLVTAGRALGTKNGLAEHIADKRLLLLLDNFEHLLDAAPDLAALLTVCPNLDLLVTSREPLHVSGEQEYPVPPFVHEESVGFFLARARAIVPDFEDDGAVPAICQRLDDLPLALELAAARVKALSPGQILERLGQRLPLLTGGVRDLPERQRTLRATIEWSYELLEPGERPLFARLAVFFGGCTLEAAEAVCDADLDSLQSLLDKSLLRRTGERFWMLETIREYAAELLEESGEADESRRRHAKHYAELAERLEPDLRTSRHVETIDRLEADHANFVRAIEWALETDAEFALALFGRLRHVWWDRSREGWMLAQRVLAAAPTRPTSARASALHAASGLAWTYGDLEQAASLDEQALAISEDLGDGHRRATALVFLGLLYQAIGRDGAREKLEQGLAGLHAAGDDYGVANAIGNLSDFALQDGDFAAAARLAEQSAARAREHGFELIEAMATCNQAVALIHLADPRAVETARSALRLCSQTKLHLWIGNTLFIVAAAIAADEPRQAAVLLGAADAELQGARLAPAERAVYEQARTTARDALGAPLFEQLREEGRLLGRDAAVQLGVGSAAGQDVGCAPTPARAVPLS
jgi:predicted ATPase/class 3 adenylate cyclase